MEKFKYHISICRILAENFGYEPTALWAFISSKIEGRINPASLFNFLRFKTEGYFDVGSQI
jgi:hypothetical protein